MQLFDELKTLGQKHIKANKQAQQNLPSGVWLACPKCQQSVYHKDLGRYFTCPNCDYGFRIASRDRVEWLTDSFTEMDQDIETADPLDFPDYGKKIAAAKRKTDLNDSILTGVAKIGSQEFCLGIMDPNFIMGSMGTVTGEKVTRLFEYATEHQQAVVLFTASGGARMQEGIFSLMQMAKVSSAVKAHSQAGLFYLSVITDPTTGGVTASFAMQGDIILSEPHALIGFAGKRVIEQTMHQKIPENLQDADNILQHGFIDAIVKRPDEKATIEWLLEMNQGKAGELSS